MGRERSGPQLQSPSAKCLRLWRMASHALKHVVAPHARNPFCAGGHDDGIFQQVPAAPSHESALLTRRLHFAPFVQAFVQGVAFAFGHSPEPRTASPRTSKADA